LPPPLFQDTYDSGGHRIITIYPDTSGMPIPIGARIYYTTTGVDPGIKSTEDPVTGTLYNGTPVQVKPDKNGFFEVTARLYPPTNDKAHFDTSDIGDLDIDT